MQIKATAIGLSSYYEILFYLLLSILSKDTGSTKGKPNMLVGWLSLLFIIQNMRMQSW